MGSVIDLENRRLQPAQEPEVSLLDLTAVLAKRKRLIAGVTLGAVLVAGAVSFILPPTYTAEAVILPPQLEQSTPVTPSAAAAALAGQGAAGALGAVAGATGFWRIWVSSPLRSVESRTLPWVNALTGDSDMGYSLAAFSAAR